MCLRGLAALVFELNLGCGGGGVRLSGLPLHLVGNTDFCGRRDGLVLWSAFLVVGTASGWEKVCIVVWIVLGVLLLGLLRFRCLRGSSC